MPIILEAPTPGVEYMVKGAHSSLLMEPARKAEYAHFPDPCSRISPRPTSNTMFKHAMVPGLCWPMHDYWEGALEALH